MVRYLLHQPEELESLALAKLGQYIALQAEKLVTLIAELRRRDAPKAEALLSQQIEIMRNHFISKMPRTLHDELLQMTGNVLHRLERKLDSIGGDNTHTHVIARMLEIVVTKYITVISFKWDDLFLAPLCSKSHILSGLTHLHLDIWGPWPRMNPITRKLSLLKLLKELHNLKSLYLNCFTDDILRCIAENSELLEVIKLPSSIGYVINDNSVDILTMLCNLKSIDLEQSNVTQKGIEVLLMSFKNLEHITGTTFLASALEHIVTIDGNAEKQFNLKSFKNDHETTLKQLDLLVQRCPLIEKLYIDGCPQYRSDTSYCVVNNYPTHYRYNLQVFNDLKNLRTLTLRHYYFYYVKINKVLQVRGHCLVSLFLYVYDVDLNALKCIIKMCPNLENLDLDLVVHYEEVNVWKIMQKSLKHIKAYVTDLSRNQKEIPPLKELKKLRLNIDKNEPMQEEFVIIMLSSCPNVEIIETGYNISLTDDIMLKVLEINPLASLKELNMWQSQLSETFINQLVQNSVYPPVLLHYV